MQPRPSFDFELLIILVLGVVLILGLFGWIFLTNERSESPVPPTVELTAIPSEVTRLATRTAPASPSATATPQESPPTATETSPVAYPGPAVETLPSAGTSLATNRPAPSETPTPDQAQALPAGKYDDTNPKIAYDRFWAFKMNSGTKFAYQGTLHISTSIGNEITFHFTGRRFILGYQRGKNFGIVTVIVDGQTYSFHEQAFGNIWRSPELSPGTHSVKLIHQSGEATNLDSIEILD